MSSSSSSVAAPAVVDKHAELLKMVNKCNNYKLMRTFCSHCYIALIDASPNTVDCRLGVLCGCGARFCGIKCLVAASQEHKKVCTIVQDALQFFAESRCRANATTNQAALDWGGHFQVNLLRADMLVAVSDIVKALVDAAESVYHTEAFELAQKFAQRALSLAAKGSLSEAAALDFLGNVARDLSKYDAAVAHYEAALKIRKNLLGDKHADVARVYDNLSLVFLRLGRLDEALAMCSSALEIFNKAPGNNQRDILACHHNIGDILRQQGKPGEAMEHFSIGLAVTLEKNGETADAATFLLNIGTVLSDQNEAMEKFVSALRIFEKAKIDTAVAGCHQNISDTLMKQGKLDEALEHARKSLAIRRSKLSIEHAECGESHFLIGDILMRSGKHAEALDEFESTLRIRKSVFGEMTLLVADVYHNKAVCFFGLRKWREAVTFNEAAIHIRTVLLGAHDADLVDLKSFLAEAQQQLVVERLSAVASERK